MDSLVEVEPACGGSDADMPLFYSYNVQVHEVSVHLPVTGRRVPATHCEDFEALKWLQITYSTRKDECSCQTISRCINTNVIAWQRLCAQHEIDKDKVSQNRLISRAGYRVRYFWSTDRIVSILSSIEKIIFVRCQISIPKSIILSSSVSYKKCGILNVPGSNAGDWLLRDCLENQ